MTKVPSLAYPAIVAALKRDGFAVVRRKGRHLRLEKETADGVIKITVPAHRPLKRSTPTHILNETGLPVDRFLEIL